MPQDIICTFSDARQRSRKPKIRLLQPTLPEIHLLLKGVRSFRSHPIGPGALPPKPILNQSRYSIASGPLAYRWTIPFLIVFEGTVVGSIGGKGLLEDEDTVEIAYNVAEAHQNWGIATEAIRLITQMVKEDGLKPIAHVEPWNSASRQALKKNGYRKVGILTLIGAIELERWASAPTPALPSALPDPPPH